MSKILEVIKTEVENDHTTTAIASTVKKAVVAVDFTGQAVRIKEIREIAEAASYDVDKIKKAYDYMLNYNTTVDVPIAFMKECIKNEYYDNKAKPIKPGKSNSFNNFEQRSDIDFEELEKQLLDN